MTTLWKWILGIVVVLAVIVAVPLGMHLLVNNGYIAAPAMYAFHHGPVDPAFDMPYRFDDGKGPGGFEPRGGWMHYGRGFGFFGPLMFFGGLLNGTLWIVPAVPKKFQFAMVLAGSSKFSWKATSVDTCWVTGAEMFPPRKTTLTKSSSARPIAPRRSLRSSALIRARSRPGPLRNSIPGPTGVCSTPLTTKPPRHRDGVSTKIAMGRIRGSRHRCGDSRGIHLWNPPEREGHIDELEGYWTGSSKLEEVSLPEGIFGGFPP